MYQYWSTLIFSVVLCANCALAQEPQAPASLAGETQKSAAQETPAQEGSVTDKASFLIGFNMMQSMKRQGAELNLEKLMEGMKLADSGAELPMSMEEARSALSAFETSVRTKQMEKKKIEGEKNKAAGEKFLAEIAKKEGIQKLENGVFYEVIKNGKDGAASPDPKDFVKVHYKGMLTNGKVFDESKAGIPSRFPVGGVIRGFSSALTSMKVGDKWKIHIPSDLAYGARGSSPRIGANETLTFEIELVEIEAKK